MKLGRAVGTFPGVRRLTYLVVLVAAAVMAASWAAVPAFASGTSYTWIGASNNSGGDNHSWTDERNWQPTGVPGTGDSVIITAPAPNYCTAHIDNVPTATLAGLSISQSPALCGVSINGGSLTVTGTFAWNGGVIATPLTLASGAAGSISGSNSRLNELSANLDVAGTLVLSGGSGSGAGNSGAMRIDNPNSLHVFPGATLQSDGPNDIRFLSCCNNPAKIINDGTLAVSGGDLTVDAVELDQNGTLATSSGGRLVTSSAPLTAGAGASYTGSGGWLIEDGARAKLSGTQTLGPGFHLELGPLSMNAGVQLGGTATLAGTGTVDWTGGTIEGDLTIGHGVTVQASGVHTDNGKRVLSGQDGLSGNTAAVLTNHGTVRFAQGAGVLTAWNAQLVNAADGVLSLAPGTQVTTLGCCVNPNRIINHGTVTVPSASSSTPATLDGVAYQSDATTRVAANQVLQLVEAPSALTSATVSGAGTLAVAAPTAVGGTITVASATKLHLQTGGSLNGTALIGGPGALTWSGGAMSGRVTVSVAAGTAITGTDQKYLSNVNGGSTPSVLTFNSSTTIGAGTTAKHDVINLGQSSLTLASTTAVANFVDIYAGTLLNTGTLTVNPGSSGTVTRSGSGPFTNRGNVTVRTGKLVVNGDYRQAAGTTTVAAAASLARDYVTHPVTITGGVLQGSGTIAAGVSNTGGTVKPGGSTTGTLRITGSYTQSAKARLALDLAANSRDRLAVTGSATINATIAAHDLGQYNPAPGAKYVMVTGSTVSGSPSCTTTSGAGSSSRHWQAGYTATGLYLTRHNGRKTC